MSFNVVDRETASWHTSICSYSEVEPVWYYIALEHGGRYTALAFDRNPSFRLSAIHSYNAGNVTCCSRVYSSLFLQRRQCYILLEGVLKFILTTPVTLHHARGCPRVYSYKAGNVTFCSRVSSSLFLPRRQRYMLLERFLESILTNAGNFTFCSSVSSRL